MNCVADVGCCQRGDQSLNMQMYLLIVLTCLLGISASEKTQMQSTGESDILTVTLFYESYCPDCISYIGKNLIEAWNTFKTNIKVDLLPWGNVHAVVDHGHVVYRCQHGRKECLANKLHACAILQACGQGATVSCKSADNLDQVIKLIHCLEQTPDQMEATAECAKTFNLDADDIKECAQSPKGDNLFYLYGNRTTAFRPKIRYVPTVAINGKHNTAAEEDLIGEICNLRPSLCSGQFNVKTNHILQI